LDHQRRRFIGVWLDLVQDRLGSASSVSSVRLAPLCFVASLICKKKRGLLVSIGFLFVTHLLSLIATNRQ
jgi:hypothetical protein